MRFEFFIARRMLNTRENPFSGSFIRIAVISVALGVMMMILSDAILIGFQTAIRDKIAGFAGHIRITPFSGNDSWEQEPLLDYAEWMDSVRITPPVVHVQGIATKAGIIKTGEQLEGVVLKGIGPDFYWGWFNDQIIEGEAFAVRDTAKTSSALLISSVLSKRLNLHPGDDVPVYFVNESHTRARKFTVAGVYETGLVEFDKLYALCDIRHIRRLNNWDKAAIAGVEVFSSDFNAIEELNSRLYEIIPYDLDSRTIRDLYPQMFDWLALQDTNVIVIMLLMVIVAGITMIATLLILILERTRMIGVLKAMGATSKSVRNIFILNAVRIIGSGLLWGNAIALTLVLLQHFTGVITLPQESYYVNTVPVAFSVGHILLINIGTIFVCSAMLLIPSGIIARIHPVQSIRIE
ncbi:MAG TPA: ABC transporter permease [Bacteroidales bacterium]|nr:ABC transporter permease [Bacteroidales bacterium]